MQGPLGKNHQGTPTSEAWGSLQSPDPKAPFCSSALAPSLGPKAPLTSHSAGLWTPRCSSFWGEGTQGNIPGGLISLGWWWGSAPSSVLSSSSPLLLCLVPLLLPLPPFSLSLLPCSCLLFLTYPEAQGTQLSAQG